MIKKLKTKIIISSIFLIFSIGISYAEEIKLDDGTILKGNIISMNDEKLIIETDLGKIEVPRKKVVKITYENSDKKKNQETNSPEDTKKVVKKINMLIKKRAFLKTELIPQIRELSSKIPESDRQFLYNINQKNDAILGLGLNLLITSLGSWVQGDWLGGITELIIAISATTCMITGWSYEYQYIMYAYEPNALFYFGFGLAVFDLIYMCVRPFQWQKQWNNKLAESLNIDITFLDNGSGQPIKVCKNNKIYTIEATFLSFKY